MLPAPSISLQMLLLFPELSLLLLGRDPQQAANLLQGEVEEKEVGPVIHAEEHSLSNSVVKLS